MRPVLNGIHTQQLLSMDHAQLGCCFKIAERTVGFMLIVVEPSQHVEQLKLRMAF